MCYNIYIIYTLELMISSNFLLYKQWTRSRGLMIADKGNLLEENAISPQL